MTRGEGVATNGRRSHGFFLAVAAIFWVLAIGAGYRKVMAYSATPGEAASAPSVWPANVRFERNSSGPTLVMLAHPHCPCTRASLTELSSLMTRFPQMRAYVFFLRPEGFSNKWVHGGTWGMAQRIPRVATMIDPMGKEAALFGARTSGQVVLYDANGKLAFSGGITPVRGHIGDSTGQRTIAALLKGERVDAKDSQVFGCPLQDPTTTE
jgi:hypothetical protein